MDTTCAGTPWNTLQQSEGDAPALPAVESPGSGGASGGWMLLSPLVLPPPQGITFERLGIRPSLDDKARVTQTGSSAGKIIPKEEWTQPVFKALQPIFPSRDNMHLEHVKGLKQRAEAEKAARAMEQEGIAFVSATTW